MCSHMHAARYSGDPEFKKNVFKKFFSRMEKDWLKSDFLLVCVLINANIGICVQLVWCFNDAKLE